MARLPRFDLPGIHQNFIAEASFLKGKQFKTWTEHTDSSYDAAFSKAAQEVPAGGFSTASSSKESGIISAGQA